MTEQEAVNLAVGKVLAGANRGTDAFTQIVAAMVTTGAIMLLYKDGYQVESRLIGEDFEEQQKRDSKYFNSPGDSKESPGGTGRRGNSAASRKGSKRRA